MSASHARRRVDVVELRALCSAHPDVLFVRSEGCPICAVVLARLRKAVSGRVEAARASGSKGGQATKRHPWKGSR